jgi:hypothetical protein
MAMEKKMLAGKKPAAASRNIHSRVDLEKPATSRLITLSVIMKKIDSTQRTIVQNLKG